MSKLELFYPAKPYNVTQVFGIYNPAYLQFGYDHHNGIDFAVDTDGIVRAMCDGVVVEVKDYPTGAGKAVRYRTIEKVEAEGTTGYVEFMYMHAEKQLVTVGQILKAGDPVIIADNTGFSTGPHTHISAYFVDPSAPIGNHKLAIGDKNSDYCFDFSKYYNGYYADDAQKVFTMLYAVLHLLQEFLKNRSNA
jgi:murein DD-endopeptidase MepM/ murein hydrolase activator NlpD